MPSGGRGFLAADEVLVERMTKKGMRDFDARGAVRSLAVSERATRAPALDLVLRHGEPAVRADDVLRAWRRWAVSTRARRR